MKMNKNILILALLAVIVLFVVQTGLPADSTKASTVEPATGEEINWQVISSGGTKGTSANFVLNGTEGQTAVGSGSSTNFGLSHGFWQEFGPTGACCVGSSCNVTTEALCIAGGGEYKGDWTDCDPNPCSCCKGIRGNVNGDPNESVNVADVTYMVCYLKLFPGCPLLCFEETDVNGSGSINVADVTYLVAYLKGLGPAPPACP
jgi:hypothetical protein